MAVNIYTHEQDEWLCSNVNGKSWKDIFNEFNLKFNDTKSLSSIQNHAYKVLNIKSECKRYTPEMRDWILNNWGNYHSKKEITIAFNKVFNTDKKEESIIEYINKRLHIKTGWSLEQIQVPTRTLPIGTIKILKDKKSNYRYAYIKVKESKGKYIKGYQKPYWVPKAQKVYEDAHGPINDNEFIIHLNQDTLDDNLENLYKVNRSIHAIMCNNKWYSSNPKATLLAIKWCELYYKSKEVDNGTTISN